MAGGLGLALAAIAAGGGQAPPPKPNLDGLCSHIMSKTRAAPETGYRYEYERIIFTAAGVPASARDKSEQLQPLRDFWVANHRFFRCDSAAFSIVDGSALKYAVTMNSYHILNNAAIVWKLDLNLISDDTGETLLDFVLGRMLTNGGNANYEQLVLLHSTLRTQGGAKYGCELPDGKPLPVDAHQPVYPPAVKMWASYQEICGG